MVREDRDGDTISFFFFFERSSWIVCVCVRYFVKKKNNQTLLELPWRGSEDMTKSPEI